MTVKRKWSFIVVCLVGSILSGGRLVATEQTPTDTGYGYYYFDERRSLDLDPNQIAIFDQGKSSPEAIEGFLKGAGYEKASLRSLPVRGWNLFSLREASGSAELATRAEASSGTVLPDHPEEVVPRLADLDVNGEFFFSPVFAGSLGPIIPTSRILVRFANGIDSIEASSILREVGLATAERRLAGMFASWYEIEPIERSGFRVLDLANRLARHPSVIAAEPDMVFTGGGGYFPNDPNVLQSWALHNYGQYPGGVADVDLDGLEGWDRTFGDSSVVTVIIDTGVDQNHADLHQIVPGLDVTDDAGDGGPINQCDNHGTPVAGMVSATIDNNLGSVGVAPHTRVISARAMVSDLLDCDADWYSETNWTLQVLDWAFGHGYRITNNSNEYGFQSSLIEQKYEETKSLGIVHFASAGNDASTNVWFPAKLDSVNAVSAIDSAGDLAHFSMWGSEIMFTGPGEEIFSTDRTGSAGWTPGDFASDFWGTSFSSPLVAGVAALLLSKASSLDPVEVEELLAESATDLGPAGWDIYFGWGMPNAASVLDALDMFEDSFDSGSLSSWSGTTP